MYKLTHQFFITGRSLFCVLFDLRKDKIEEIEYWLQLIITRAGDEISIFIIGTHADDRKFREDGILQSKLESIANKYSSRCKKIILITAISSLDGTGIEELRDSLINEALKQNHFGEFIPKQFILLEDAIVNLREEKRKWAVPPIVSWNDYLKLVDNCYIHSPSVIQFATLLLHDLGVLLYFKYDHIHSTTPTQFIIIDPQWLIDMTVCLSAFLFLRLPLLSCLALFIFPPFLSFSLSRIFFYFLFFTSLLLPIPHSMAVRFYTSQNQHINVYVEVVAQ